MYRAACLAIVLCATTSQAQRALVPGQLVPGQLVAGSLRRGFLAEDSASYALEVPDDALSLHVLLASRFADLDLIVTVDERGEAIVHGSETPEGVETVVLHRFHPDELLPGRCLIEVAYPLDPEPRWGGRPLESLEFSLLATLVRAEPATPLPVDRPLSLVLDEPTGRVASLAVEVPAGAEALRIDVLDTSGNVDLLLRRGRPALHPEDADLIAEGAYGRETLVVTGQGRPKLRPGTWFLTLLEDTSYWAAPTPVTLRASLSAEPPPELLEMPAPMAATGGALARALPAVVELFPVSGFGVASGSGFLVSADGLLLTAAHTVADLGDTALDELVVALTLDPWKPAVALFRARVLASDNARDLALLEIHAGHQGRPLPDDYVFPSLTLGDDEQLSLGDPLWSVGYPGVGGKGSRATLTVTRGVLAGVWGSGVHATLKLDAVIGAGFSGGPVLDSDGQVVGVITDTVGDDQATLAFARPERSVPDAWRQIIAARQR